MAQSKFEQAARDHANSRNAEGSRYLYNNDLDRWLAFCRKNRVNPEKPRFAQATAFKDELSRALKPQTVRRTLAALSSMYQAAVDQEKPLATWNPFKRLPRPPADAYSRTEAYSQADAEALITAAEGRDRAILLLMYETGLRRASVANLRRVDVIERDGAIVARVVVKGGKHREVAVPARAASALTEWMKQSSGEFIFSKGDGTAIEPTQVNQIVNRYAKIAGVKHAHPHRFRASYATAALDAGVPLHDVQASMHHSDPSTTQRYDRGIRGVGVTDRVAAFREQQAAGSP